MDSNTSTDQKQSDDKKRWVPPDSDMGFVAITVPTDDTQVAGAVSADTCALTEQAAKNPAAADGVSHHLSSPACLSEGSMGMAETVVQAVNTGTSLDALLEETAAGRTATGSDGGAYFVRLAHVLETLDAPIAPTTTEEGSRAFGIASLGAENAAIQTGGTHVISGGRGSDSLFASPGSDVFHWSLGDQGSPGAPASDTIDGFSVLNRAQGGDVLDLRDLLQGETQNGDVVGNLANYLHFEHSGSDTVVHISSMGQYSPNQFDAHLDDQLLRLNNADLIGAATTDSQIIKDLLAGGKLLVD